MNRTFWGLSEVGWQAIGSMATVVAVVVGAAAAFFAFQQVRAARELREEQARPYVIVDFEPGLAASQLMDMTVKNIGQTPALEVIVKLTPEPTRARETHGFHLAASRISMNQCHSLLPDVSFE